MKFLDRLKNMILPEEADFFALLMTQAQTVQRLLQTLTDSFVRTSNCNDSSNAQTILKQADEQRWDALRLLNRTFITPVDKEAISRVFFDLNMVTRSAKHFMMESQTYGVDDLSAYRDLFDLIAEESEVLHECIVSIHRKQYDDVHESLRALTDCGDRFSAAYAETLAAQFESSDGRTTHTMHELLFQLKDINHKLVRCGFALEDIVFKLN